MMLSLPTTAMMMMLAEESHSRVLKSGMANGIMYAVLAWYTLNMHANIVHI